MGRSNFVAKFQSTGRNDGHLAVGDDEQFRRLVLALAGLTNALRSFAKSDGRVLLNGVESHVTPRLSGLERHDDTLIAEESAPGLLGDADK